MTTPDFPQSSVLELSVHRMACWRRRVVAAGSVRGGCRHHDAKFRFPADYDSADVMADSFWKTRPYSSSVLPFLRGKKNVVGTSQQACPRQARP